MNDNPLAKWISENRTTRATFAREAGIQESHLCLLLQGKRGVSFRRAKRISAATGGTVPVDVVMEMKERRQ